MRRTLTDDNASFRDTKRGLLVTEINEVTTVHYYIPRVNHVSISEYGETTTVKFGKSLQITMPNDMWVENGRDMLTAALGEGAVD